MPLQSVRANASCPPSTSKSTYPAVQKAAAFCFALTESDASFTDKYSETKPRWVLAPQLPRRAGCREERSRVCVTNAPCHQHKPRYFVLRSSLWLKHILMAAGKEICYRSTNPGDTARVPVLRSPLCTHLPSHPGSSRAAEPPPRAPAPGPPSSRAVPAPCTVPSREIAAESRQLPLERERRTNAGFEEKRGGLVC